MQHIRLYPKLLVVGGSGPTPAASKWFVGPVSLNGVTGPINNNAYMTSNDGVTFSSPVALPGGLSIASEIRTCNGLVWMNNSITSGIVSLDFGASWQPTTALPADNPIYWNGTYFYSLGSSIVYRSADGITWASDPTQPAGSKQFLYARAFDNLLVVGVSAGTTQPTTGYHYSYDSGASYTFHLWSWNPNHTISADDGFRIWTTTDSNARPVVLDPPAAPVQFSPFIGSGTPAIMYGAGVLIGKNAGTGVYATSDGYLGSSSTTSPQAFPNQAGRWPWASNEGRWVANAQTSAGAMPANVLRESTDGVNYTDITSTIYGLLPSVVCVQDALGPSPQFYYTPIKMAPNDTTTPTPVVTGYSPIVYDIVTGALAPGATLAALTGVVSGVWATGNYAVGIRGTMNDGRHSAAKLIVTSSGTTVSRTRFDGPNGSTTFTDTTGKTWTAGGSAALLTRVGMSDGTCVDVSAVGARARMSDASLVLGTQDFQFEGWVERTLGSGNWYILDMTTADPQQEVVAYSTGSDLRLYINGADRLFASAGFVVGVRTLVRVSRKAGRFYVHVNGEYKADAAYAMTGTSSSISFGDVNWPSGGLVPGCYMDNWRLVIGRCDNTTDSYNVPSDFPDAT